MSEIFVDPKNADIVYVPSQNLYRSNDGGHTFTAIKGAPGGDDYHSVWIDPTNSQRIMLGVDQGATISLNGGESWSTWYNQPTGEFYRVATDHRFPYWVYGPQQDSGTAGIASRGNNGQVTEPEWNPVGPGESGYTIPDPVDPDVGYNAGPAGSVIRLSKTTGQVRDLSPAGVSVWSTISILEASHFDAGTVYAAVNRNGLDDLHPHIFRTRDFGQTWQETVSGIRDIDYVRTVREDPVRKGLLYAGTEEGVYVSFDDGDHWESLRLNMPVVAIHDLAVEQDDLRAASYGRSFWILDDVTPLRQVDV